MSAKRLFTSGYGYSDVSAFIIHEMNSQQASVLVRDGEGGEVLLTLSMKSDDTVEYTFPQQGDGSNFNPNNGVYFDIVVGQVEILVVGQA